MFFCLAQTKAQTGLFLYAKLVFLICFRKRDELPTAKKG